MGDYDSDEEDMIAFAAIAAAVTTSHYYINHISKDPCRDLNLNGKEYIAELVNGNLVRMYENLSMNKHVLQKLYDILRTKCSLQDARGVDVDEQVAMFLYAIRHEEHNKIVQKRYQTSKEIASRHFNTILDVVISLVPKFLQPAKPDTLNEILNNLRFFF
ncbi:hypothetical protein GIB67_023260 [Kingdonia uniflora]|uniref:DUF8040 domain-containing protein n=1 Tax=Kingdonia uniflora TaxID=39325 RepID=A0A7J7LJS2_9MAGN|nr:hypothetical protein GIB67_023260 [Kingdonia uniflora]